MKLLLSMSKCLKIYKSLKERYQNIISIDLMATNKSGEKVITDEYEKILKHNDFSFYKYIYIFRYDYFDFHKKCHN